MPRFTASYHSKFDATEGGLLTVGVMLLQAGGKLHYRSDHTTLQSTVEAEIRSMHAQGLNWRAVFDDLRRRGNGVSVDWSNEFEQLGANADLVSRKLLSEDGVR